MESFATLVNEWERCNRSAFEAYWQLEAVLDAWCDGAGAPPAPARVAAARRLRFIAHHRLRWMLYQTRRARAALPVL